MRLLTLKEVNSVLGRRDKKCRFVHQLRDEGVLTGAYIGGKLMFKESEVREYIESEFERQNKRPCMRRPELKRSTTSTPF